MCGEAKTLWAGCQFGGVFALLSPCAWKTPARFSAITISTMERMASGKSITKSQIALTKTGRVNGSELVNMERRIVLSDSTTPLKTLA